MASKGSTDRKMSLKFISSAVKQQGPTAVGHVVRKLEPFLPEGAVMPDIQLLMQLMIFYLESQLKFLIEADEALLAELADDAKYRQTRDEAAAELIAEYGSKRDTFNGLFGSTVVSEVGFEPRVEYQPDRLALQVERVLNMLTTPGFELPVTSGALQFDPAGYAAELTPPLDKLRQALLDVERERRDAQIKQLTKEDATTGYDTDFLPMARLFEAIFLLAGLDKLAQSLRPSQRRPGRRVGDVPTGGDENDDEPSAEEPGDEPSERPEPAGAEA